MVTILVRFARFFAAALVALGACAAPAVARPSGSDTCPSSPTKINGEPGLPPLPADAKITAKDIRFQIDIGSDGRVRALQMVRSSGDIAVDAIAREALQKAAYVPAQTGCVAFSSSIVYGFAFSDSPTAGPAVPIRPSAACTPYVTAFLTPVARDRKKTGTAIAAIDLDAAGTQTGIPVLKKGTGSPVLDAEALRIARSGQFNFVRDSGCAPQAFTYLLEITFQ